MLAAMITLLSLWVALAAAAPEPSTPTPAADAAAPAPATAPAPALGCGVELSALVQRVTLGDDPEASVCMAGVEEAGPALIAAIGQGGPGAARLTSALALWRMQRLDVRIPDAEARMFSADDRRLLRDAVQARRGRTSPSPAHAAVFSKFDWYKPVPVYTPGRLTAQDKENMATLDKPPPEPKPVAPAAEAMAEAETQAPEMPKTEAACGCASTGGGATLGGLALVVALAARRRARRPAGRWATF